MIEVDHVYKSFGRQAVLEDITLRVPPGELLVVLGESGSGKSVLLKHLIGILKPDRGAVRIDGQDLGPLSERKLLPIRKEIGYLFQEGALYDFMTVYENVAFPLKEHTRLRRKAVREKVLALLDLVGLSEARGKYPSELSGGMKKRAALARSVALDSRVLLCDEPTSGLDPIKSKEISDLIRSLSREFHCTTVVTSHDMVNAMRIADRVVLIRQGRILAQGTPEEMRSSPDAFLKEFFA